MFYQGKLVLPRQYSCIPLLIKDLHEPPLGGHNGYFRTFKRVVGVVHWERTRKDIKDFVMQCEVCQRNKTETLGPAGLLQLLPFPRK